MRDLADLAALFAAGAIPLLAYLALGLWILQPLRLIVRGAERLALAFAFGTGVASLSILGLRTLDVPVGWPLCVVIAVSGIVPLLRRSGTDASESVASAPAWRNAIDIVFGVLCVATFLAALAPETTWDGFEYHIPMVQAWVDGPMRALPAMLDSEFRAGVDLLFVPALSMGQPDAAATVSAGFAVAIAVLVRAEATRRASPIAGSVAGVLVLLAPFTMDLAPTTYVDLGVGVYGFLALLFADRWNRDGETSALLASALCLAFAANAKLHAAMLGPTVLVILLAGGRVPRIGALAGYALWVAALTAPWFAKSALTTGNPFFPLFGDLLGYGPSTAENLRAKSMEVHHYVPVERSLTGFFAYLAGVTYGRLYHIGGLLGPLPLALAPLAVTALPRRTIVLAVAIAALVPMIFLFMPALRFGAPLLPFLAIAAAVGGSRLAASGMVGRVVVVGCCVVLSAFHGMAMWGWYAPRIASLRTPSAYERSVFPDQDALREMVGLAPEVVAIPKGAVSWMPKRVYNLHWSRNGELFFDRRTRPAAALALLRERGVASLVLDVDPRARRTGGIGHPIVDAWLRSGDARIRSDVPSLKAAQGREWVLVELSASSDGS